MYTFSAQKLAELEALLRDALNDFEKNYPTANVSQREPWARAHDLPLCDFFEKTVFADGPIMLRTGNGYTGLLSRFFGRSVLSYLIDKRIIDDVISWIKSLFTTTSATVRIVTPLWGVSVSSPSELRPNTHLYPMQYVANSKNLAHLRAELEERRMLDAHTAWDHFDTVLVAEVTIDQLMWRQLPGSKLPPSKETVAIQEELKLWEIAMAMSLVHPVFSTLTWEEFVDQNIVRALVWRSYRVSNLDVLPKLVFNAQLTDIELVRAIVDGFLKARSDWRSTLERAAQRFRRSMFQSNAVDAALDLFLSLEIVLAGRGAQDGIVTRASHLVGTDRSTKLGVYADLSHLQRARSQGAHGASAMKHEEQQAILKTCRPHVADVLRQCISLSEKPNMEGLQLGYLN